jgi:hypothetical protein
MVNVITLLAYIKEFEDCKDDYSMRYEDMGEGWRK